MTLHTPARVIDKVLQIKIIWTLLEEILTCLSEFYRPLILYITPHTLTRSIWFTARLVVIFLSFTGLFVFFLFLFRVNHYFTFIVYIKDTVPMTKVCLADILHKNILTRINILIILFFLLFFVPIAPFSKRSKFWTSFNLRYPSVLLFFVVIPNELAEAHRIVELSFYTQLCNKRSN